MRLLLLIALLLTWLVPPLYGQPARPVSRALNTNAISRIAVEPRVNPQRTAAARPNEVLVPVDLGTLPLNRQEVLVNKDRSWTSAASALEVTGNQTNLVVKRGEQFILRPQATVETKPLKAGQVEFPGLMVCGWSRGPDTPLEVLHGRLFLRPRQAPLPWDAQSRAYATKLVVGLDLTNHQGSINLDPPVTVEFFPANADVRPSRITIQRTGTSGYQETDLRCLRHDAATVTARSDLGELECPVEVVARLGGLAMSVSSKRVPGWGLGTTQVICERQAEDGSALLLDEPTTLRLESTQGKLSPVSTLVIPAGASSATAELRSSGLGNVVVTGTAAGFEPAVEVRFIFPVAFLIATALGGCVGGGGRIFRQNVRSSRKRLRLLLEGCVAGVVAVAAVTAGMVIGDIPLPAMGTELGAFLVAALSGYAGVTVLDRLVAIAFPQPAKPPH